MIRVCWSMLEFRIRSYFILEMKMVRSDSRFWTEWQNSTTTFHDQITFNIHNFKLYHTNDIHEINHKNKIDLSSHRQAWLWSFQQQNLKILPNQTVHFRKDHYRFQNSEFIYYSWKHFFDRSTCDLIDTFCFVAICWQPASNSILCNC